MAAELEKLANELTQRGHSVGAQLVKDSSKSWFNAGLIPKKLENNVLSRKEIPQAVELNLDEEWQRQSTRFVELGFHTELKIKDGEYLDSLPKFGSQPEAFRGRFDIPVLVEVRIPISKQCEMTKVQFSLKGLKVVDWSGDPQKYKTPRTPYTIWMQDGTKNLGITVDSVRENLAQDERGATVADGMALYIAKPDVLRLHYIDLPGTQVESGYAPYLDLWYGQPELRYHWADDADSHYGSASCGSKVVTK